MEWLNYHHLLYFWIVAREGSIARASAVLRLSPSTISGQVRALEHALGSKLVTRTGRGLAVTDAGQFVLGYANQIFGLGRELLGAMRGRTQARPATLVVGIVGTIPKLFASRLLEPALHLKTPVRLVCVEDGRERLLAELAVHGVDVVLSDAPVGPGVHVRAFNHLLGECGVSFLGAPPLAGTYRRSFPRSLDGAPFLLPREGSILRGMLERWFETVRVQPRIVGEFNDSALLKAFGQAGAGIFVMPQVIERAVCRQYRVQVLGRVGEVRERFYVIALERKLTNEIIVAIQKAARTKLFA